jgi:hypothetical protein
MPGGALPGKIGLNTSLSHQGIRETGEPIQAWTTLQPR